MPERDRGRRPVARVVALTAVLIAVLAAPLVAWPQPAPKVSRVGVIGERSASDYAHGDLGRISQLATELAQRHVEVLVVGGTVSALAARSAAPTTPIVFTTAINLKTARALRLTVPAALVARADHVIQ